MGSFLIVPFVLGKERSFHQEGAQLIRLDRSWENKGFIRIAFITLKLFEIKD